MKYRARRRVLVAMASLGVCQMALQAQAGVVYLNEFATATTGFSPWFVGSGPNGQVVVTDYSDNKANYYGPDGSFQGSLVRAMAPLSGLNSPYYPLVGYDGNYYVSDNLYQAIEIFGTNGIEQSEVTGSNLFGIFGIALSSSGTIYAASSTTIYAYKNTGQFESSFNLSQPSIYTAQLALDAAGSNLYLADPGNNSIDAYSTGGTAEGTFGSSAGPGQLNGPTGVAVSGSGLVYVVDKNAGIKVYSSSGSYLETVATTVNGQPFTAYDLAVSPLGMVYAASPASLSAVYRFFDPASWVSGTNTFTNASTGPTSVAVGSGQLLGTNFTLSSGMGLTVGVATTVNNGGVFTIAGGTLNTPALVVDGTSGANFTVTGGSITTSSFNVSNGGVADFVGSPLSVALTTTVNVTGSASQLKVDQGAIVSTSSLTNTGQVIVGTSADLIVYSSVTNSGTVNLTGGELDIRGTLTNSTSQSIQGTGTLSTTLGLINSGTLALSGSSSVLGPVNNSGGTIHLSGNTPNVFYGATTNTGTLTIDAGASGTFYGAFNGSAGSSIIDNGSLYLNANSVSGSISGTGNLTIGSNSSSPALLGIGSNSGASALASVSTLGGSTLDMANNTLVLTNSTLASVRALVTDGYDGGKWNGNGITSSTAASDTRHLTALGVIANDNGHGVPLYGAGGVIRSSLDGASPADGNILVKYTYYGDANLDGKVNSSDYTQIDNGYLKHLTGWFNGDFNYDGTVNGSDYTLIDNAFNMQGASLATETVASETAIATAQLAPSVNAVPEPRTLCLIGIASIGLLSKPNRSAKAKIVT